MVKLVNCTETNNGRANVNKETSKKRILIAEDNSLNQIILRKVLESMGYTNVTTVDNGKAALDILKTQTFQCVLMDCMMPIMGGIEATECIRREIPMERQPIIIALTANVFAENRDLCINAGMNEVLTKPINKEKLESMLGTLFERELY